MRARVTRVSPSVTPLTMLLEVQLLHIHHPDPLFQTMHSSFFHYKNLDYIMCCDGDSGHTMNGITWTVM